MQLPIQLDSTEFDSFRLQPALWLDAVREVCLANKLVAAELRAFTNGSNLVALADNKFVVKIFPPIHRQQWESEHNALSHLAGKLSFPIPELIATGELENDWTYVTITFLAGESLENMWPQLTHTEQVAVMSRIGQMMAEVRAMEVGELSAVEPEWHAFINKQLETFYKRHKRLNMPGWFLSDVERFVAESLHLLPEKIKPVILTGEYTPFNLLANASQICGMIDFGDAFTGYNEYDLLGPSMFLAAGDKELIIAFFHGYGYTNLTTELRRRLMLLQILHRYSNFAVQLCIPQWQDSVHSIEQLEELIWPLA